MIGVEQLRALPEGESILVKGDPTKIIRRVASLKKLLMSPNDQFECRRYIAVRAEEGAVSGFLLVEITRIK